MGFKKDGFLIAAYIRYANKLSLGINISAEAKTLKCLLRDQSKLQLLILRILISFSSLKTSMAVTK